MKKMEAEMEQVFEMKVKEKRNKIKESEADVSVCSSDECHKFISSNGFNCFILLFIVYQKCSSQTASICRFSS